MRGEPIMGTSVVADAMASHDEINTESAFLQARSTAQVTVVEQSFFAQVNLESSCPYGTVVSRRGN